MADEVKKEEEKTEVKNEKPQFDVYALLAEKQGPDKNVIDQWKKMYNGDVFCSVLGKGEPYVFRSISRLEWKALQEQAKTVKNTDDAAFSESVVRKCVLFPLLTNPEAFATLKAGTIPTLFDQITWYSNFMEPAMAIQMVYEL